MQGIYFKSIPKVRQENKNDALFAQMFFVDERRNGEPLVQTFLCGECKRGEFMHRRENGKFLVQTFLCD